MLALIGDVSTLTLINVSVSDRSAAIAKLALTALIRGRKHLPRYGPLVHLGPRRSSFAEHVTLKEGPGERMLVLEGVVRVVAPGAEVGSVPGPVAEADAVADAVAEAGAVAEAVRQLRRVLVAKGADAARRRRDAHEAGRAARRQRRRPVQGAPPPEQRLRHLRR